MTAINNRLVISSIDVIWLDFLDLWSEISMPTKEYIKLLPELTANEVFRLRKLSKLAADFTGGDGAHRRYPSLVIPGPGTGTHNVDKNRGRLDHVLQRFISFRRAQYGFTSHQRAVADTEATDISENDLAVYTRRDWSRLAPDQTGHTIHLKAEWTALPRTLISVELLGQAGLRYEARPDIIAILGTLGTKQIIDMTHRSAELRARRPNICAGQGESGTSQND